MARHSDGGANPPAGDRDEQLKDAMADMADHAAQALRDAAKGDTYSAAVNQEFAQAAYNRATDILSDIANDEEPK